MMVHGIALLVRLQEPNIRLPVLPHLSIQNKNSMAHTFLLSLNEVEFKAFLREALLEIMGEREIKASKENAKLMTIKEAATFLKLKVSTLYEKTAEKTIPHVKRGKRLYFYIDELETWLKEGKVKTVRELQSEAATYTMQHGKNNRWS
jgi:excisionase family DNA binding protein